MAIFPKKIKIKKKLERHISSANNVHVLSLLQTGIKLCPQTRFIGFCLECDPIHAQCFRTLPFHAPNVFGGNHSCSGYSSFETHK